MVWDGVTGGHLRYSWFVNHSYPGFTTLLSNLITSSTDPVDETKVGPIPDSLAQASALHKSKQLLCSSLSVIVERDTDM